MINISTNFLDFLTLKKLILAVIFEFCLKFSDTATIQEEFIDRNEILLDDANMFN